MTTDILVQAHGAPSGETEDAATEAHAGMSSDRQRSRCSQHGNPPHLVATVAIASLAFLLLGYHPAAEDGAIYSAAVAARLDGSLFPHDRAFVVGHTEYGLFVSAAAALARLSHLSVDTVLLLLQVFSLCALTGAAMHLARTCFPPHTPTWPAAAAVALGAGLPVAGTSLYAVDPYCTARSLTTPVLLLAFSLVLRGRRAAASLAWFGAACVHPLMALWSGLLLLFGALGALRKQRFWLTALALATLAAGAVLQILSPAETSFSRQAALTRVYWFPKEWRWFEWFGAAAPPLLLWLFSCSQKSPNQLLRRCARICSSATFATVVLACLFVHETNGSLAIARLQPLRTLHLVFAVFLATAGPWVWSQARMKTVQGVAILLTVVSACAVFWMQRSLYPNTRHVEWPHAASGNGWQEAFQWCRQHTPADALFALPADYIDLLGEDSHGFRSIAHRSAVPDAIKDAGIAAVLPRLAPSWQQGVTETTELSSETDLQRRQDLLSHGVTWIVLPAFAQTALPCPFINTSAKVCRLK